jgi:hypothetical protein
VLLAHPSAGRSITMSKTLNAEGQEIDPKIVERIAADVERGISLNARGQHPRRARSQGEAAEGPPRALGRRVSGAGSTCQTHDAAPSAPAGSSTSEWMMRSAFSRTSFLPALRPEVRSLGERWERGNGPSRWTTLSSSPCAAHVPETGGTWRHKTVWDRMRGPGLTEPCLGVTPSRRSGFGGGSARESNSPSPRLRRRHRF